MAKKGSKQSQGKKFSRRDRFVVGHKAAKNCVYGRRRFRSPASEDYRLADYCDPLTITQARQAVQEFPSDPSVQIFELVPVEVHK